jgi:NADH-quinone oxidoreductase subunit J
VMVYIGSIAILIIFAVMLTRHVMDDIGPQMNRGWWLPLVGCLLLFAGLVAGMRGWKGFQTPLPPLPADSGNLTQFGLALVSQNGFVIPFEAASILLLAALIGAIYLGTEGRGEKK